MLRLPAQQFFQFKAGRKLCLQKRSFCKQTVGFVSELCSPYGFSELRLSKRRLLRSYAPLHRFAYKTGGFVRTASLCVQIKVLLRNTAVPAGPFDLHAGGHKPPELIEKSVNLSIIVKIFVRDCLSTTSVESEIPRLGR